LFKEKVRGGYEKGPQGQRGNSTPSLGKRVWWDAYQLWSETVQVNKRWRCPARRL